ncbi:MAG: phosphoadenosine phosphosulfate reductase family protein [Candidatus Coproplasma sp.]
MKHTKGDLKQMQSLPLSAKIIMTQRRIRDWYDYWDGQVYVSFSGGKDSTVLLHIARQLYPDIEAVFVDTGLEYPEIRQFVKTFDNVTILRPKMRFDEVIKKYGYPIISKEVSQNVEYARKNSRWALYKLQGKDKNGADSKRKAAFEKYAPLVDTDIKISNMCCSVMKKKPAKDYEKSTDKKPIIATLAEESSMRENAWLKNGCNAFNSKRATSQPMSFWTEQDILQYIKENNLPIASVYGDVVYKENPEQIRLFEDSGEKLCTTGCDRTGCIFCAFGAHLEKGKSRFERLKETHPRQYEYCIGGGEYVDGVWQPNKQGLGMGHVFDELNKIYGDGFIKY